MGQFLKNTSISYLEKCYKEEKNPKVKIRLLACMYKKRGMKAAEISRQIHVPKSTLSNLFARIERDGLRGRYDLKIPGKPCKLTDVQIKQLMRDLDAGPERCGFEAALWSGPMVLEHIRKKFGVHYALRSVEDLLHRIGFSRKKPRPEHHKSASRKKRAEFKKKAQRMVNRYHKKGYKIYAIDEKHYTANVRTTHGWFRRNKRPTIKVNPARSGRISVIAALGVPGELLIGFYKSANTDTMIEFLEDLDRSSDANKLVFWDSASYHTSGGIDEFIEKLNGRIILEPFPMYTPELNPVEVQWRELNRGLSGRLFKTIKSLKRACKRIVGSRRFEPVGMPDYLIPDELK